MDRVLLDHLEQKETFLLITKEKLSSLIANKEEKYFLDKETYFQNGDYLFCVVRGKQDGFFILFYKGNLVQKGTYVQGKEESLWTAWHEDNSKNSVYNYSNGKKEGY